MLCARGLLFSVKQRLHVGGTTPPACGRARSSVCRTTRPPLPAAEAGQSVIQDATKCASELRVEDGVDDRVQEAVDVAEPDEEREQPRVDVAQSRPHPRRLVAVTSASGRGR